MLRRIEIINDLDDGAHNLPTMAGALPAGHGPTFRDDVLDKLPPPERAGS